MTHAESLLPPDEHARLDECAREPIHVPGAIQPHGALLTVDPSTLAVLQVSANSADILGVEPAALAGRPLPAALGAGAVDLLHDLLSRDGAAGPVRVVVDGRALDVVTHPTGGVVVVEFEPASPADPGAYLLQLHAATQRLAATETVEQLRAVAATEVRRLTGFDRVMLYHFHPDGHGEVVAEDRAEDMEPYLGLHYPASDIPQQARRLYVLQRSRLIVTNDYQPAAILPAANPATAAPLDLTFAELRSVSRSHLLFMRNMGVAASMSLSLVRDGDLVGMISCGHRRPRHVPLLLRRACEIVAQQVTLQLAAVAESERLRRRLRAQHVRAALVQQASAVERLAAGLAHGDLSVLDLVPADGATVGVDGQMCSVGTAPPHAGTRALIEALAGRSAGVPVLTTDALANDRPDLAALVPSVAGLAVVPLGGPGDFVAWFRREVVQTVDWLGGQGEDNRATPLSPRNSFELWRQTVTGRSLPWDEQEVSEGAELRREVEGLLQRRTDAQLAHLGLHDALTGLPNRRLLLDRLEHALRRRDRGAAVALLFLDLDRFKSINDTLGHDVGDQVIAETARRIVGASRAADTVARIGGDEFVVLCEDTDAAEAQLLAQRIVGVLAEPVEVAGQSLAVTASVGLSVARPGQRPADLLRESDTAMYVAKESGRNRAVRFDG